MWPFTKPTKRFRCVLHWKDALESEDNDEIIFLDYLPVKGIILGYKDELGVSQFARVVMRIDNIKRESDILTVNHVQTTLLLEKVE